MSTSGDLKPGQIKTTSKAKPTGPAPDYEQREEFNKAHGHYPTTTAEYAAARKLPNATAVANKETASIKAGHPGGRSSAPAPKGHASSGSVQGAIISFLRGKGLNDAAIAGILGNMQVESGFRTSAYNGGEGAIGLVQWEGGRRSGLDSYARSHGGSETDLDMQLGYMWHELTTSYSGVLNQLKHVTSAAQAATIWDEHYEISSGSTRQQRISNAESFASSGLKGGPMTADASFGGGSAGVTAQDYQNVDSLGRLLSSVPELNKLLKEAQSGNWTAEKFQNEVEDSKWYKSHSSTARSIIIQQANDPASYSAALKNAESSISALSKSLGMPLTAEQLSAIASTAMLTGNDSNQQWLTSQISSKENYSKLTSVDGLQSGMAATVQQLQTLAAQYGFNYYTPADLAQRAQAILNGTQTIDTYKQRLIKYAKSAFPGLASELDQGETIKDLADPYVQSMASLLEIDPATLDAFNPTIRKAMQGISSNAPAGTTGKSTGPVAATPLWQFEQQVRADPRWQYTDNAKQSMATMALQLGQTWGFNG